VKAEREGFKKAVEADFKLDINQVVRVDFTLVVARFRKKLWSQPPSPWWNRKPRPSGK